VTFTLYGEVGPMSRVERWGLVLALALATALMIPLRGYLTDDTFIHLQYARHLAYGQGLVFNVGERVYGCTSPLWVALLADGIALGFRGLTVAKVLGFLATLWSVVLFLQLMRRNLRTPLLRAAATVAWAGHAWMLRWSLSGMETPLAVALTLAGFVAYTEGRQWGARPVRTGALWALAALTRPEAVLLLFLWGMFLLADTDSRPGLRRLVFGALPAIIIYGAWMLFARAWFGTVWPQTLSAKAAGGHGLAYHLEELTRQAQIVGATDGMLTMVLVVALLFGGRQRWPGSASFQRLLPWVWLIAVPTLYFARGVPVLSRYLLPLLPVLAWLAWRALESWILGERPDPRRAARLGAIGVAVAVVALGQNLVVYRTKVVPQVESFSAAMRSHVIPWARRLGEESSPDDIIASPDIGAFGYFSQRRILDLGGLVTPEMVPLLDRDAPEEVVSRLGFSNFSRPRFLVDRGSVAGDLLQRSPYAPALEVMGSAPLPNLGVARPDPAVYTFYRVNWARVDSMRRAR